MIGAFWRWLVGRFNPCAHEWEIMNEQKVRLFEEGSDPDTDTPMAYTESYVLRCKKCGDLKQRKFTR